ncbi:M28 family metallopeptidase [Desulfolutivibrio sp.]|uniref:M28 family metallopeptidase n=1 Tax=Desulfolutivibrio sp. TaxID=2773296 RepID=UPI002F968914
MQKASSTSHAGRLILVLALVLAVLVAVTRPGPGLAAGNGGPTALAPTVLLARVDVTGAIGDIPLPIHSELVDGKGLSYALVIATPGQLQGSGIAYTALDEAPPHTRYLLGAERRPGARQTARDTVPVLYDDGRRIIVRDAPGRTAALVRMGLSPRLLRQIPIDYAISKARRETARTAFSTHPQVQAMLDKVTQKAFSDAISGLSGETAITVEGEPYTLTTRHTSSGIPITKATLYIYERLQALGLTVSFQEWTSGEYSGRNVIGELPGQSSSSGVVLMVAHLDSINDTTDNPADPAPGADDDASGCAALLVAAGIMKDNRFENDIRFVFTTGEENGILGSAAYAKKLKDDEEELVGVLNLDMISYSTQQNPVQNLHTRAATNPTGYQEDMVIANVFVNVINGYGLSDSLIPVILSENNDEGDHYSFWENQFPAIMAIEDDNNFNPNYHCNLNLDRLQYLNLGYGTAHVKASLGAVAHLAIPLSGPPAITGPSLLLLGTGEE